MNEYNDEYEVLIGIDHCEDTLHYIHQNDYPSNFRFFYFLENKGPYIIKNTLCKLSKYEKILFFDSDDVMMNKMLHEIDTNLDHYEIIKPKYINFTDDESNRVYEYSKPQFGEGVFGIRKPLFLWMNGFEGWKVAADSDFMGRLYSMRKRILHTNHILFHRRKHPTSLTQHPNTGVRSKLRGYYALQSRKKTKDHVINKELMISEYKEVDFTNKDLTIYNVQIERPSQICYMDEKKQQHDLINDIFNKTPIIMKAGEEPKRIDYNKVSQQVSQNRSNTQVNDALKKAKLENIRRNSRR
jgi:hypothetical protein